MDLKDLMDLNILGDTDKIRVTKYTLMYDSPYITFKVSMFTDLGAPYSLALIYIQ